MIIVLSSTMGVANLPLSQFSGQHLRRTNQQTTLLVTWSDNPDAHYGGRKKKCFLAIHSKWIYQNYERKISKNLIRIVLYPLIITLFLIRITFCCTPPPLSRRGQFNLRAERGVERASAILVYRTYVLMYFYYYNECIANEDDSCYPDFYVKCSCKRRKKDESEEKK